MEEIIPGVFHWKAEHPEIGKEVSSYYLALEATLLDPIVPEEGLDWFKGRQLGQIVLTNRYHTRDAARFRKRFGCPIRASRVGIEMGIELEDAQPFEFGDTLPGGIVTLEVGAISPDDTALFMPRSGGIVAFGDGLMRGPEGWIDFVDEELMADTIEQAGRVRADLQFSIEAIMARREFKHLLFAHGDPVVSDGKKRMRDFLDTRAKPAMP